MDRKKRRPRSRVLAVVAAAAAASLVLASGTGFAAGVVRVGDPPASTPALPATPPLPSAVTPAVVTAPPAVTDPSAVVTPPAVQPQPDTPAFGAFLDSGAQGIVRMAELSTWLGGADLRVGHTYLPGNHWSDIEGAPGFLDVWADWRTERADR